MIRILFIVKGVLPAASVTISLDVNTDGGRWVSGGGGKQPSSNQNIQYLTWIRFVLGGLMLISLNTAGMQRRRRRVPQYRRNTEGAPGEVRKRRRRASDGRMRRRVQRERLARTSRSYETRESAYHCFINFYFTSAAEDKNNDVKWLIVLVLRPFMYYECRRRTAALPDTTDSKRFKKTTRRHKKIPQNMRSV